jgi:D-alanine-D-alanine ligase
MDVFFGFPGKYSDAHELFGEDRSEESFSVPVQEPDLDVVRALRQQDNDCLLGDNVLEICRAADIVFLALHGDEGENGKLQACLDIAGIPYTGCGYLASALAMNKTLSKRLFHEAGIPTPPGVTLSRCQALGENSVGYPCVVKPCSGGSSVAISIAHDEREYHEALKAAFLCEDKVIVERYIKGRELTVGVIGRQTMPVIEIIPKEGFYDYKNKYQPGLTLELCPAPIGEELTAKVQELALQVCDTLMIETYGRVDFIVDDSDGVVYCLEANTLPGMTPPSLMPRMAEEMGMDFGGLCEKIVEVSLQKYGINL